MQGRKNSPVPNELLQRARELRIGQTDAEALIWRMLRGRQTGYKFRRQHVVCGYVLDFYCDAQRLAVELDGGQHAAQKHQDLKRDRVLLQAGIRTIRFWNDQVLLETESVLAAIWNELVASPHPNPLPEGEGADGADDEFEIGETKWL